MTDPQPPDGAVDTRKAIGRVLLCVVDDTDELSVALQFAALRANRTGAHIGLLYVIEQATEFQHWSSIGDLMRAEAQAEAERVLTRAANHIRQWNQEPPVYYIREGDRRDAVIEQIKDDPSIAFLIMGAATGRDGSGPLVTALTGRWVGQLHIPIVIVPGNVSAEEIESFA